MPTSAHHAARNAIRDLGLALDINEDDSLEIRGRVPADTDQDALAAQVAAVVAPFGLRVTREFAPVRHFFRCYVPPRTAAEARDCRAIAAAAGVEAVPFVLTHR